LSPSCDRRAKIDTALGCALIVVLWRGGLRIAEALALGERDFDPRRASLLVRNGKGGRRREIGTVHARRAPMMSATAGLQL
jgi:integrase